MGYNQNYVDATKYQADINKQIADAANDADIEIAVLQSKAVVAQAEFDYKARLEELKANRDTQFEALRVREKEAELQHKVDWKNAQSEAIRADGYATGKDAELVEAKAEDKEVVFDHEKDMARYGDRDTSYFYG